VEDFNTLVNFPASLIDLPHINEQNVLKKISPSSVTAVLIWRPTDPISIRVIRILNKIKNDFSQFNFITILAPKYKEEKGLYSSD
jgi:hypothetical protein